MKKIAGRCHCGQVTYEATVNPELVYVCHCTDCQTLSGTAFSAGVIATYDNFKVLTGTPSFYIRSTESGVKRRRAFCPDCGTPIYAADMSDRPLVSIRVGTSHQRAELTPTVQIWCRSALNWVQNMSAIRQSQMQPSLSEFIGSEEK